MLKKIAMDIKQKVIKFIEETDNSYKNLFELAFQDKEVCLEEKIASAIQDVLDKPSWNASENLRRIGSAVKNKYFVCINERQLGGVVYFALCNQISDGRLKK